MKKFADRLIQWGIKEGRTGLPWKDKTNGSYDPYKIWVSEIMLQQTRVASVLPKFNQFIKKVSRRRKTSEFNLRGRYSGMGGIRILQKSEKPTRRSKNNRERTREDFSKECS